MRFIAIDLETANPDRTSICQIGLVGFEDGREIFSNSMLIDPCQYFEPYNVHVHGITEQQVAGQPRFEDVFADIETLVNGEVAVSHTAFDRTALEQSCAFHGTRSLACRWLDSARVARQAWPQFSRKGYGLKNLAKEFGIDFQHHDAVEDARTAGLILLRAMEETGLGIDEWFQRVKHPISPSAYTQKSGRSRTRLEGSDEGPLAGEVCVFTGAFSISRTEAAEFANRAGAAVDLSVTKKTTLVVVGDQTSQLSAGKKSRKHRRAEELIASGFPIRILLESDLRALIHTP